MEFQYVQEKSKYQFLASNLNIHSMYGLYQSEKGIEVNVGEQNLEGISSIFAVIWVFINQKKIAVKLAEFQNATPQKKTLLEEKY